MQLIQTGGSPSGGGAVSSVFGRTGIVVAASGDYTAAQITNALDTSVVQAIHTVYAGPSSGPSVAPVFRVLVASDLPSLTTLAVTSLTGDSLLYSNAASQGAATLTLNTQTANKVLAGPASGSAANPTFRSLVAADLPVVTLSGFSGFWGGYTAPGFANPAPSSATGWPANQATAYLFYLGAPISITKVTINVTTLFAASLASAGIYSTSGAKLVDSGTFNCASTGVKTNTIGSVTLQQGWYYFVWTNNSASTGFEFFTIYTASATASMLNTNGTRIATGTATTSAALNSTLGTLTGITAGNALSVPCVLFE